MSELPPGMNPKRRQLLAVARKRLGMVEEGWRELLREHGGVNHSRDLDDDGFDRVMLRLRQLGFTSSYWQAGYGERRDMASPHQLHKIRALWRGAVDQPTEAHLHAWLEKMFKVSALRFLTAEYATARQAMHKLRGENGRLLGIRPTTLVVPTALERSALQLINNQVTTAGGSNEWYQSATLIITPWLEV